MAAAQSMVKTERAGVYPTVALRGGVMAVTPAPDFGQELTWQVGLGLQVPVFQGGVVDGRVRQAQARASQADAGSRALRERAEIEVRQAHGVLVRSLSSLEAQAEAVDLAEQAVAAAETRLGEGGGTMLQLQQAQIELVAAKAAQTKGEAEAARAADVLRLVARGTLGE